MKDNIDKVTQITKQQISTKSTNQEEAGKWDYRVVLNKNEETEELKKDKPFVINDKQKQSEYIWQYLQDICSGKENKKN